jgi:hypothetical protein
MAALRLADAIEAVVDGRRVVPSETGGIHVAFRHRGV